MNKKSLLIKKEFKILKSFLQKEYGILKVIIKVFKMNKSNHLIVTTDINEIKKVSESLLKIIEEYIKEAGINANVSSLYNKIFEEIEYFVTFKAKEKGTLADNNIHFQIMI